MRRRSRSSLLALGAALLMIGVVGVAFASSGSESDVPEGPSIDFCPTTEQIEAHLKQYGFDYKPTVTCGEDGEEVAGSSEEAAQEAAEGEQQAVKEKELLLASTIVDDGDGDPLTIGIRHPDGTMGHVEVFGSADYARSLTVEDLAEILFSDAEVSGE